MSATTATVRHLIDLAGDELRDEIYYDRLLDTYDGEGVALIVEGNVAAVAVMSSRHADASLVIVDPSEERCVGCGWEDYADLCPSCVRDLADVEPVR